jgi:acetyl esterase/lipase
MGVLRSVLCAVLVSLCSSGEGGVDRNKSAEPLDDLSVHRDINYAPGERHRLDVYAPLAAGEARPVIVFFYGGGWISGTKADFAWIGAALARQGYVAVVPDYRLHPLAHWPEFLLDCATAVRWVRDNVGRYGGSPSTLVLMGHSAGAYNAFALAVDRRWLAAVGMNSSSDLKAMVGLSGPYTMEPHGPIEEAIFDVKHGYTEPIDRADGKSPPLLLIIGDNDRIAGPKNSDEMAARIRELGGAAEVIHYPSLSHGDTVEALGNPPRQTTPIMRDIRRFLAAQGIRP